LDKGINLTGATSLHTLDCAENRLKELDLSNLPKLNFVSCRANRLFVDSLKSLKLTNCKSLEFLETTLQHDLVVSDFHDCQNLKELYCSSDNFDWRKNTNLEKVEIFKAKVNKEGLWNKDVLSLEILEDKKIDVLAQRNTSRVIKILANPNNYSSNDILNLDKKQLHGVSDELKEKLFELVKEKKEKEFEDELRKRFNIPLLDDELEKPETPSLSEDSSGSSTPTEVPAPEEIPTSSNNPPTSKPISDYKKLYLALQQKITELETKIKALETGKNNEKEIEEIRNEIISSNLSEEETKRLLKLLEEVKVTSVHKEEKPTNNVVGWAIGIGLVMISLIVIGYFVAKKKVNEPKK